MIIEFKLANYRSINAEETLSFVAENARRHPGNLIQRPGYKLLKAAALFGANASGKSNFVKAIGDMQEFVRDSATRMNEGDPITIAEPFRLDPATREAPSRFEITFVTEDINYTYGFAVTRKRVESEWLTAKREKTEAKVCEFRRTFNGMIGEYVWDFGGFHKADVNQIKDRTLDNMLALSVGPQQKVERLRPAYTYLRERIQTFDMSGEPDTLLMATAKLCQESEDVRQALSSFLGAADTGIESLNIGTAVQAVPKVPTDAPVPFQDAFHALASLADFVPMPRITARRHDSGGKLVHFDLQKDESRGTQRFFAVMGPLLEALTKGGFIVMDELDASMHPLLTRRLLELFQSAKANPNGAQLLFTTHDASLLDEDLFRRDQIWLAEKCEGASTFFSLADIRPPVRNTESFLRNYLVGRYGGTPHLGLAFDDLAVGSKV